MTAAQLAKGFEQVDDPPCQPAALQALEVHIDAVGMAPAAIPLGNRRRRRALGNVLELYKGLRIALEKLVPFRLGGEVAPLSGAAAALAFNLPRSDPDPTADIRIPSERAHAFADRAMIYLARAIDQGELTREELSTNADFDALRRRTDFDELYDRLLDRGFPIDPFLR